MVVADSCYSGTLVRGTDGGSRKRGGEYWKEMASKWARVAITSGGLEPVADKGGGGHSPFAKAFIDALGEVGCRKFVVHARIAILEGLSPKDNRTIPPLNYERVFRLKRDFPDFEIVINGGLADIDQVDDILRQVDGAMIGRQAYHQPYFLAELENHFNPDWPLPDRREIVEQMLPYIDAVVGAGQPLARVSRHMLGLFAGQPGARAWRRYISEHAHLDGAGAEVLSDALNTMLIAA
jgi:tRNA-dihydrouridine synthase A